MACLNYYAIVTYIEKGKIIGKGKESDVYSFGNKVIKLFHEDRESSLPRISDDGLKRLTELSFFCFNTPIDVIYKDGILVGYTESFLEERECNLEFIDFDGIKADLITLSENGYVIEDLFYNYVFTDDGLVFFDLTSYHYLKTDVAFLKQQNFKKNLLIMNNFLIGLLHFGAFSKGASNEYTKIYLANPYRLENCEDEFYGDFIKKEEHFRGKGK